MQQIFFKGPFFTICTAYETLTLKTLNSDKKTLHKNPSHGKHNGCKTQEKQQKSLPSSVEIN